MSETSLPFTLRERVESVLSGLSFFFAMGLMGLAGSVKGGSEEPIGVVGRILVVGAFLTWSAALLWWMKCIHRGIGRRSPLRRRHGQYVLWWMFSGFLVGGLFGVSVALIPAKGDGEIRMIAFLAIFGLLVGWLIGTIHGAAVNRSSPRPDISDEYGDFSD